MADTTLSRIDAALADALGASAGTRVKPVWTDAREWLKASRAARPGRGRAHAAELARATDLLVQRLYAHSAGPVGGEQLAVMAVGGYGRGELAPFSDIDLLFVTEAKQGAHAQAIIAAMLHALWDLGFKVGHATRTPDEVVRQAKADLTIRTAMLDARRVTGDAALGDIACERFRKEVVAGSAATFVREKLAERSARHTRMGDSRYLVEPNLKEGKGGLRDLHTLWWIGKYVHRVRAIADLVGVGLLTRCELQEFERAEDFFWAVRCQLHDVSGRAEDRLTFDVQSEIARRLKYATRAGSSDVERFMRHYYLHARHVGALTGVFLAELETSFGNRSWIPRITRRPRHLDGFTLKHGRIGTPSDSFFADDPVRLIALLRLGDVHALEIDPAALRQARRDARLIDDRVRRDPIANALFLDVLASPRDPETMLRAMSEAGIFGRFVPDFGRVVALSQFNMYHWYTVDEHTIRAIGLLARIERGALASEYPLASTLSTELSARRALRVAVLLHDIAKGRGGDHSVLGAEIADRLCPRLGLGAEETETVAWLVRWHLIMSDTAFRRDLSDPATLSEFALAVGSPERLRLLTVLTTVDIGAVGPGVWTPWKGQLLRELYEGAAERLKLGHKDRGRGAEVSDRHARLQTALGRNPARFAMHAARFDDAYWIAETADTLEANARLIAAVDARAEAFGVSTTADPAGGVTQVSLYAADAPGLFGRAAGAVAMAGASIADARIHTTRDGRAVDNFTVTDPMGKPFAEPRQLARLEETLRRVVGRNEPVAPTLNARPPARARAEAFRRQAAVYFNTRASNRFTICEVNALDRPGLVHALADAIFRAGAVIRSAHIATYGERAVDVFYLTDTHGRKLTGDAALAALETELKLAAGGEELRRAA